MALTDEEVARFRGYLGATMRGFLDSAAMTPSQSAATTFRAKAASYAAVLQMLDEAEGRTDESTHDGEGESAGQG